MIEPGEGIILEDGQEYLCLEKIEFEGKNYVYLTTIEEPYSICFGEEVIIDNEPQIIIIGEKETKLKLLPLFQEKIKNNNS